MSWSGSTSCAGIFAPRMRSQQYSFAATPIATLSCEPTAGMVPVTSTRTIAPPVARPDPLLSSMNTDVEEDENFSTQQDTPTVRPSMASTSTRAPTQDVDISDAEGDAEVPDAEGEDGIRKRNEWAVDDQEGTK